MTEADAYTQFSETVGRFYPDLTPKVNQGEFDWALRHTCEENRQQALCASYSITRGNIPYQELVEGALDLLITWYQAGVESVVRADWDDLTHFVSIRRPGAAWCTFLRKSHEAQRRRHEQEERTQDAV